MEAKLKEPPSLRTTSVKSESNIINNIKYIRLGYGGTEVTELYTVHTKTGLKSVQHYLKGKGKTKMSVEKLLTQAEVREITGLSDSTLERWRREGKGPRFVRIGRSIRYKVSDLEMFYEEIVEEARIGHFDEVVEEVCRIIMVKFRGETTNGNK